MLDLCKPLPFYIHFTLFLRYREKRSFYGGVLNIGQPFFQVPSYSRCCLDPCRLLRSSSLNVVFRKVARGRSTYTLSVRHGINGGADTFVFFSSWECLI